MTTHFVALEEHNKSWNESCTLISIFSPLSQFATFFVTWYTKKSENEKVFKLLSLNLYNVLLRCIPRLYLVFSLVWPYYHHLYAETHVIFINKLYNLANKPRSGLYIWSMWFFIFWMRLGIWRKLKKTILEKMLFSGFLGQNRLGNFAILAVFPILTTPVLKEYFIYVFKTYRYYVGVISLCIFQISYLCDFYHGSGMISKWGSEPKIWKIRLLRLLMLHISMNSYAIRMKLSDAIKGIYIHANI